METEYRWTAAAILKLDICAGCITREEGLRCKPINSSTLLPWNYFQLQFAIQTTYFFNFLFVCVLLLWWFFFPNFSSWSHISYWLLPVCCLSAEAPLLIISKIYLNVVAATALIIHAFISELPLPDFKCGINTFTYAFYIIIMFTRIAYINLLFRK